MNDCIFCKIAAGDIPAEKVYEDDLVLAFKDLYPHAPVHILFIPREHLERLDQATSSDHEFILGRLNLAIGKVARDLGLAETGYRVIVNNGPDSGQEVHHVHYHLLGGRPLGPMLCRH